MYFDGSGDYLTVPDSAAFQFGTGDFTMELWVWAGTTLSTGAVLSLIHKYIPGTGNESNQAWQWYIYNDAGVVKSFFQARQPGSSELPSWSTAIPTYNTQWNHAVVVRSGNNLLQFWNGVLTATTSYTVGFNAAAGASLFIGARQNDINGPYNGYMSNIRIVKGTALYLGNFIPPTGPLPAVPGTSLLLTGNNFVDRSGNNFTVSRNGDTRIVAFSPFTPAVYNPAVHGGSAYFDGTTDALVDTNLNNSHFVFTGDFTIEYWVYSTTHSGSNYAHIGYLGPLTSGLNVWGWAVSQYNSTDIGFFTYPGGSGNPDLILTGTVSGGYLGQWTYITVVRQGSATNNIKLYANGVQIAQGTKTGTIGAQNNNYFTVGGQNYANYVGCLNGYITNVRITNGTALYASSFTRPNQPLTSNANTNLLFNFTDAAIQDLDAANVLETVADAREVNFGPLMSNYSVYFDGTGDYLSMARNTAMIPGANVDFTFEAWIYPTRITTDMCIMGFQESQTNSDWIWFVTSTGGTSLFNNYFIGNPPSPSAPAGSVLVNRWSHVVISRTGSTISMGVNGVSTTSTYSGTLVGGGGYQFSIGADQNGDEDNFFGYIHGARVIVGTGLYPGTTYTVPTQPYSRIPNTQFLGCMSNRFIDLSANNGTIVRNGDAKVTDFSPFGAQTANPPSIYFDGTGDYCVAPIENTINYTISGHSWTFECWFYKLGTVIKCLATCGPANAGNINRGWSLSVDPANSIIYMSSSGADNAFTGVTIPINAWNHIAYDYNVSSTTMRVYLNGVLVGTKASPVLSNPTVASSDRLVIGATYAYAINFDGYISDLRWTRGQTLYSGFEPPTQPFATR